MPDSAIFIVFFFFFNDTATTEIYTLSLHDALPISGIRGGPGTQEPVHRQRREHRRSEEHTSELQSRQYLVCRLLLEKKKKSNLFLRLRLSQIRLQISERLPDSKLLADTAL